MVVKAQLWIEDGGEGQIEDLALTVSRSDENEIAIQGHSADGEELVSLWVRLEQATSLVQLISAAGIAHELAAHEAAKYQQRGADGD